MQLAGDLTRPWLSSAQRAQYRSMFASLHAPLTNTQMCSRCDPPVQVSSTDHSIAVAWQVPPDNGATVTEYTLELLDPSNDYGWRILSVYTSWMLILGRLPQRLLRSGHILHLHQACPQCPVSAARFGGKCTRLLLYLFFLLYKLI